MKRVAGSDTSVLKQHYEKKVFELEHEKKALQVSMVYWLVISSKELFVWILLCWQKEIENLKHKLGSISSTSGDGAQKLKEEYLQKLNVLESQVDFVACM